MTSMLLLRNEVCATVAQTEGLPFVIGLKIKKAIKHLQLIFDRE